MNKNRSLAAAVVVSLLAMGNSAFAVPATKHNHHDGIDRSPTN